MPVTFKNAEQLTPVTADYETVKVSIDLTPIKLELEIPKLPSLPYGLANELFVLQSQLGNEQIGRGEYFLKTFCLFTQRLPMADRLNYGDLRNLNFPPGAEGMREQIELTTALTRATVDLQSALNLSSGDEGNAKTTKPAKELKN